MTHFANIRATLAPMVELLAKKTAQNANLLANAKPTTYKAISRIRQSDNRTGYCLDLFVEFVCNGQTGYFGLSFNSNPYHSTNDKYMPYVQYETHKGGNGYLETEFNLLNVDNKAVATENPADIYYLMVKTLENFGNEVADGVELDFEKAFSHSVLSNTVMGGIFDLLVSIFVNPALLVTLQLATLPDDCDEYVYDPREIWSYTYIGTTLSDYTTFVLEKAFSGYNKAIKDKANKG